MLHDNEIVELRNDPNYREVTTAGLKGIVTDLIRQGQSDIRPDVGTFIRISIAFTKARVRSR